MAPCAEAGEVKDTKPKPLLTCVSLSMNTLVEMTSPKGAKLAHRSACGAEEEEEDGA